MNNLGYNNNNYFQGDVLMNNDLTVEEDLTVNGSATFNGPTNIPGGITSTPIITDIIKQDTAVGIAIKTFTNNDIALLTDNVGTNTLTVYDNVGFPSRINVSEVASNNPVLRMKTTANTLTIQSGEAIITSPLSCYVVQGDGNADDFIMKNNNIDNVTGIRIQKGANAKVVIGEDPTAYILPFADGTQNQVLSTDGLGQVSFTTLNGVNDIIVEDVIFNMNNSANPLSDPMFAYSTPINPYNSWYTKTPNYYETFNYLLVGDTKFNYLKQSPDASTSYVQYGFDQSLLVAPPALCPTMLAADSSVGPLYYYFANFYAQPTLPNIFYDELTLSISYSFDPNVIPGFNSCRVYYNLNTAQIPDSNGTSYPTYASDAVLVGTLTNTSTNILNRQTFSLPISLLINKEIIINIEYQFLGNPYSSGISGANTDKRCIALSEFKLVGNYKSSNSPAAIVPVPSIDHSLLANVGSSTAHTQYYLKSSDTLTGDMDVNNNSLLNILNLNGIDCSKVVNNNNTYTLVYRQGYSPSSYENVYGTWSAVLAKVAEININSYIEIAFDDSLTTPCQIDASYDFQGRCIFKPYKKSVNNVSVIINDGFTIANIREIQGPLVLTCVSASVNSLFFDDGAILRLDAGARIILDATTSVAPINILSGTLVIACSLAAGLQNTANSLQHVVLCSSGTTFILVMFNCTDVSALTDNIVSSTDGTSNFIKIFDSTYPNDQIVNPNFSGAVAYSPMSMSKAINYNDLTVSPTWGVDNVQSAFDYLKTNAVINPVSTLTITNQNYIKVEFDGNNQTVPTNTDFIFNPNGVVTSDGADITYDGVGNFTINVVGTYHVHGEICFKSIGLLTSPVIGWISVNGSNDALVYTNNNLNDRVAFSVSKIFRCNIGDVINIYTRQESGGSLDISSYISSVNPQITIYRLF